MEVKIPKNAYLTDAGDAWRCERGYYENKSSCAKLVIPLNAHIDYSGGNWECDNGFRKYQDKCQQSPTL